MKAGLFLAFWLMMATAAAESWRIVYQGGGTTVSFDAASLKWTGQVVMFRERVAFQPAQIDPASLRRISEVQYRKLADCSFRQMALLSRAVFSENSALVGYEAVHVNKARWQAPQTEQDVTTLIAVCGSA